MISRFNTTRPMPSLSIIEAWLGTASRNMKRQSRITLKQSESMQAMLTLTKIVEAPRTIGKKYKAAIVDYNEAIRLDPDKSGTFVARGNSWDYLGEFDKALADYAEAIRLDSNCSSAYYNRGYAWQRSGNYEAAIVDYEMALKLDPNDTNARENLAKTLVSLAEE